MAKGNSLGKSIVLLFLIVILILGGLLWFDFLGAIHIKSVFAPVYKMIGLKPQTSVSATASKPLVADIDEDRLARQREALDIYLEELEKRDQDSAELSRKNEQIAAELAEREKSLEEREKTFNNIQKQYDNKEVNINQIAANLEGMPPKNAVAILIEMDDQMVIDVLRKVDERAAAAGTSSMVSYWLSLMPSANAATIQRKMAQKPMSLD